MLWSTTYMSFEIWWVSLVFYNVYVYNIVCAAVIKRNKVNSKRRVQYNECQIYLCNIQKDFQQVTYPTWFERQKSHEGGKKVERKVVHMHVQSSPLTWLK